MEKNCKRGKSVNDDLDSFFEGIAIGEELDDYIYTYFSPKLTKEQLELVARKNADFIDTFDFNMRADVTKSEMAASESTSKFVRCNGMRQTFIIKNQ